MMQTCRFDEQTEGARSNQARMPNKLQNKTQDQLTREDWNNTPQGRQTTSLRTAQKTHNKTKNKL